MPGVVTRGHVRRARGLHGAGACFLRRCTVAGMHGRAFCGGAQAMECRPANSRRGRREFAAVHSQPMQGRESRYAGARKARRCITRAMQARKFPPGPAGISGAACSGARFLRRCTVAGMHGRAFCGAAQTAECRPANSRRGRREFAAVHVQGRGKRGAVSPEVTHTHKAVACFPPASTTGCTKTPHRSRQSARRTTVPQIRANAEGIAYFVRAPPRSRVDVVLWFFAASARPGFRGTRKPEQRRFAASAHK